MTEVVVIPESQDNPYRLGRNVQHDPRSRAFRALLAPVIKDKAHRHYGPILGQGDVGACTYFSLTQWAMTKPGFRRGRYLDNASALSGYQRATEIDPFEGTYPPNDTGSDGVSACKVGVERGLLSGYDHTFSLDECLRALGLQPVMVGTNWYEQMFSPDANGRLTLGGPVVGGHEYVLTAINNGYVRVLNSWTAGWGLKGFAWLSIRDLGRLLEEQGDCTVPRAA